MESKEQKDFYDRLRKELEKSTTWPSQYLFKFIVRSDEDKITEIIGVFDNMGAVIDTKTSSNNKYTSVSIQLELEGPDAVIEKYKEVGKIEGVLSL